mgnify:FL=1
MTTISGIFKATSFSSSSTWTALLELWPTSLTVSPVGNSWGETCKGVVGTLRPVPGSSRWILSSEPSPVAGNIPLLVIGADGSENVNL